MPLLIFLSPPRFKDVAHRWWAPSGTHCWHGLWLCDYCQTAWTRDLTLPVLNVCLSLLLPLFHTQPYICHFFTQTNSPVDGCRFVRTHNNFMVSHLQWMVWDSYISNTTVVFVTVALSTVPEKKLIYGTNNTLHFYFLAVKISCPCWLSISSV